MQNGFVLEGIAADHVHVDVGAQPRPDIGMAAEVGHGAFHLRSPDEAQRAFRTRQRSTADQPRQHARRFQNGHASAAVVICARPLVIQMAAVNDFAARRVGAGNDAAHHRPVSRTDFSFHLGVQNDLLSRAQTCPQRLGGVPRNHESESRRLARIQMAPTHHGAIQT